MRITWIICIFLTLTFVWEVSEANPAPDPKRRKSSSGSSKSSGSSWFGSKDKGSGNSWFGSNKKQNNNYGKFTVLHIEADFI